MAGPHCDTIHLHAQDLYGNSVPIVVTMLILVSLVERYLSPAPRKGVSISLESALWKPLKASVLKQRFFMIGFSPVVATRKGAEHQGRSVCMAHWP